MHLSPAFVLPVILIVAWKREKVADILFIISHNRNKKNFQVLTECPVKTALQAVVNTWSPSHF